MLKKGLYEKLINKKLEDEIDLNDNLHIERNLVDRVEVAGVLSKYVTKVVESSLKDVFSESDENSSERQVEIINKVINTIDAEIKGIDCDNLGLDKYYVKSPAEQLINVYEITNSSKAFGNVPKADRPLTSISQSSLFTGAKHEPQLYSELVKEIRTCDRVDMLVSFIRWSGLRFLIDALKDFTNKGGKLRVITTSYMGVTEIKSLEELSKLQNTEIKVSYDTKHTRLHAKTYIFHRDTGYTTAYVGSSNISKAALTEGTEWNVKITNQDLAYTMDKITATFDQYWNMIEFEQYTEGDRKKYLQAIEKEKVIDPTIYFNINPYPFQQEILDKLKAERELKARFRNLIVAATGTGKTVISAFDYKHFRNKNGGDAKLLFVAHRKEILEQSMQTFRAILREQNFGELFLGNYKPDNIDHLFVSIQTFNSRDFTKAVPDKNYYDYIIVDEFHHAAAKSYGKLLSYYEPKILLGLTATPERMDGQSILKYFDDRIAAEIRLPEAIERKLLVPFHYFGITDNVDLSDVKWVNGGYDKAELNNIFSIDTLRARKRAYLIIESVIKYVNDIDEVKGLGFCVSKEHAVFMTKIFNESGIACEYLTSDSDSHTRNSIQSRLKKGEIKFIFVVDLYNEGVDIPEVNTVLFLRPTESLTVFLQQLGRGLRISEDKECLTVLDFIAQAHKRYRFEDRFQALLANTDSSITKQIKNGFPSTPRGSYIQLEKVAKDYILDNIKSSFNNKSGLIYRIESFMEDTGQEISLKNFLNYYHIEKRLIYKNYSFYRLCVDAGIKEHFKEDLEELMTKAFYRLINIDSRRFILFIFEVFKELETYDINSFNDSELRMLNMFHFTIWQKTYNEMGFNDILEGFKVIKSNSNMYSELIEILEYNYDDIDFVDEQVDLGFNSPLDLYCQYTRDQLLVGLDYNSPTTMQSGVIYLKDKQIIVLLITLNKSEKEYSPTTMYDDYSIDESLFHWQSQSNTSEESVTGRRYINHKKDGIKVLLFVREYRKDIYGIVPYTFLGVADYLQHIGSRPMSIIWKLDRPIPAKFLKKTNKLVVG